PTITTPSLTSGVVGFLYNQTLSAKDGTVPYSWSASGLPPGLRMDSSTGVISGTPTMAGDSNVVVLVTDSSLPSTLTGTKAYTLTIAPPPLSISTASLNSGAFGLTYSQRLEASGGNAPYTWSAVGLPDGLGVNSATGLISGAPGVAGAFTVVVTVSDSSNPKQIVSKSLSLSVGINIATPLLNSCIVGATYNQT